MALVKLLWDAEYVRIGLIFGGCYAGLKAFVAHHKNADGTMRRVRFHR
jgi:hypothetical protein